MPNVALDATPVPPNPAFQCRPSEHLQHVAKRLRDIWTLKDILNPAYQGRGLDCARHRTASAHRYTERLGAGKDGPQQLRCPHLAGEAQQARGKGRVHRLRRVARAESQLHG